ncbi:AAA domain-containing protein [Mycoplasmoides alvi]|uniref:AAA domain-containing protein n=1 Tax=Mycoplasmoides alvi TaxID=78580 RepID=UPI000697B98E|nr:AAA domain-containing protein [Mycoplasmoides alvi]
MAKSLDFKLNNMIVVKKMDSAIKLKKSSGVIDLLSIIDKSQLHELLNNDIDKVLVKKVIDVKEISKELLKTKKYEDFLEIIDKYNINAFSNAKLKQFQKDFNKDQILDAIQILNDYDFKLKKNLKSLSREANNSYLEKGIWSLYICFYFLSGSTITTKTPIKGPLVNIPIDFKFDGTKLYIIKKEKALTINERLYVFLMHEYSNNLPLNQFNDRTSLSEIITDLEKITNQPIICNKELLSNDSNFYSFEKYCDDNLSIDYQNGALSVIPNAIVCNLQLTGGKLKQDLSNILSNDPSDPFESDSFQKSVEYYENQIVTTAKSLIEVGRPINIYQKYAISSALEQNTLIIGAPGTGKSEVISNLIANIIYNNKNAMLVSEKKAALDVLVKRSGELDPLILYAYDFDTKDNFYKRILNMEEKLGQWYRNDFSNNSLGTLLKDKIDEFRSFNLYFSNLIYSEVEFAKKKDNYSENFIDFSSNKITSFDVVQHIPISGYLLLPDGTNENKLWKSLSIYLLNNFDDIIIKKLKKWFEENHYIFDVETFDDFIKKIWSEYVYFNSLCEEYNDLLKHFPNIVKTVLKLNLRNEKDKKNSIAICSNKSNTIFAKYLYLLLEKQEDISSSFKLHFIHFPSAAVRKKYKKFALDLKDFLNSLSKLNKLNWVSYNKIQEFKISSLEWKTVIQHNWWSSIFSENRFLELLRTNIFQETISLLKRNKDSFVKDNDLLIFNNQINLIRNNLQKLSSDKKDRFLQMFKQASKPRKPSVYSFVNEYYQELKQIFSIWVMSPDVVAEFIPLNRHEFDYGIFDEASQMFLERGYPLVYRCSVNTIAGDSNQLKPTSFFMTRFDDNEVIKSLKNDFDNNDSNNYSDAMEIDDNESIVSLLDKAENSRWNKFHLRNHYRSVSKQLVEFSNMNIYNNNLNIATFNGLWRDKTLEIFDINGRWINRSNKEEAEEILKAIKINHKKFESILVIAFNIQQADLIEDMLVNSDNVDISIKEKINKCIFITNLESVQGSEADLVLLSVGFAKNEDGILRANFGAINKDGGRNRLNVAITRAKSKMIIFKSFKASDIPAQKLLSADANVFINWIRYLDDYSAKESEELILFKKKNSNPKFDNQFVNEVYEELLKLNLPVNYYVSANLPVGNKKIDIGIMDSSSNKCALGILIDRWSSLMTAKDRIESYDDQLFLESRGYVMYRIKEYEWILMKNVILDSIKSKLLDFKNTELVE